MEKLWSRIGITQLAFEAFCRKWKIARVELFGSVLREDFGANSDIDLLVTYEPTADWSLLDHVAMQNELSDLCTRKVDILTRRSVERSRNPYRRESILASATTIYAYS